MYLFHTNLELEPAEYDNALEATNRLRYTHPSISLHDLYSDPVSTFMNPWYLLRKIQTEGLETILTNLPDGEWYTRTYMSRIDAIQTAALEEPNGRGYAEWAR